MDADGIDQAQDGEFAAKVGVVAVGGKDDAARQARRTGRADLVESDPRLERGVRRDLMRRSASPAQASGRYRR